MPAIGDLDGLGAAPPAAKFVKTLKNSGCKSSFSG
jgi:hypothetical protein